MLSSVAKAAGHETRLLFVTQEFTEPYSSQTVDDVVSLCEGSDLVGVSLMSNFWDNSIAVTRAVKEGLGIPVIWGGIHPTVRPEECLDHADYAAVGEAEESFIQFLNEFGSGNQVPGIMARGQTDFEKANPPEHLDHFDHPDFDLENHFILDGERMVPMTPEILRERSDGIYLTIPSRGCPFDCTYCCNVFLNKEFPQNRTVRHKSMVRLVDEIEEAVAKLGIWEKIKFDDDAFFALPLETIQSFAQDYKKRIGLPLMITGVTPNTVKREKLDALVEGGLCEIRMGIETASKTMRTAYKRPQTENKVEKAAALINEYKDRLVPFYDLIIDNPWEDDDSLVETMRFITRLPMPFELIMYSLTFYPGTDIYDDAVRDGLVTDDVEDVYRKYYHSFQPTYLNALLDILTHYAHWNEPFPIRAFDFATNSTVRNSPLSKAIPPLLKKRLQLILKWRQLQEKIKGPPADGPMELSPQTT